MPAAVLWECAGPWEGAADADSLWQQGAQFPDRVSAPGHADAPCCGRSLCPEGQLYSLQLMNRNGKSLPPDLLHGIIKGLLSISSRVHSPI